MVTHSPPASPTFGGLTISKKQLTFALGVRDATDIFTLTNPHDLPYAFKVKTTNPHRYIVRPNLGAVAPSASVDVVVALHRPQASSTEAELEPGIAKDKFLLQSAPAPGLTTAHTPANFWASETLPEDTVSVKLRVAFVHSSQDDSYQSPHADTTPRSTITATSYDQSTTPISAYKSPLTAQHALSQSALNRAELSTQDRSMSTSVTSSATSAPVLSAQRFSQAARPAKSDILPDADELLRPGNGVAARVRAEKLQNEVDNKASTLAALKADYQETRAETDRVLRDAPKAPLAANQIATDPFGGLSIAAIALFILLFAVLVKAIF